MRRKTPSTLTLALLPLLVTVTASSLRADEASEGSIESRYLSNVRQITSGYERAGEGYFSPDGKTIIYQAITHDYPFYQIYSQPLTGGEPRLISTGRGRTTCAYFSPDGNKLLFASSHLDPNLSETEQEAIRQAAEDAGKSRRYEWVFDPHMDIFEADLDGSNLRNLTNSPGYDAEGAYSPDGTKIAFCSTRTGSANLFIMDADGSNLRQLTDTTAYDGGPFISPCGQWIVFRADRKEEGYLQIYVIRTDGTDEVQLTDNVGVNWAPYWHPTEPYIIWAGADHSKPGRPNYDLWLMRYEKVDGKIAPGPVTRITDHPGADVLPVFTPDGRHLMWTSTRTADGSSQLWYADFQLPETPGDE